MSLKTRKTKINQTLETTREIFRRNKAHRVYRMTSPSSQKPYQVITDWSMANSILTVKCELFDFSHKIDNHPANTSKYICCQFLASVKYAAKKAGKIVSFCERLEDAKRLLNFGGQLVKVVNESGSVVWATVR